jgi:hypothetical protein
MKVNEQMGLNPTQGRRISKRLEELGLIRIHTLSTGKRGGQIHLVEVTELGWELLAGKGFTRPPARTQGDWEHEAAALLIEARGKQQGYGVSFEVDLGGLRMDVQWTDRKSGQRWLFNIGISRPIQEVASIEKFFSLPVSANTPFILVTRDPDFAKKVTEILQQRDPQGTHLSRIEIKRITDFLDR